MAARTPYTTCSEPAPLCCKEEIAHRRYPLANLNLGLKGVAAHADCADARRRRLSRAHWRLGGVLCNGFETVALPPFMPSAGALDDWQTTTDNLTTPAIIALIAHDRSQAILPD